MGKKLAILGSTGSIGKNALKIVDHLDGEFEVVALAAKTNIDLLEQQALRYRPHFVAVWDKAQAALLQKRLPHLPVLAGEEGVVEVATYSANELLLSAMCSFDGVLPTLKAIEAGIDIALANKEVLVSAGALVKYLVAKHGAKLIPVDSEHTAIYQCLVGENPADVHRILLTASGGPFREVPLERLATMDVTDALKHPNYAMGAKVTIDSSTLMNKGLEMIEAHYLYDVPIERIEVVVHPQQVIHSMVEFVDGSILAQMGDPTMLLPIQYALTHPKRMKNLCQRFNIFNYPVLEFLPPNLTKFRCLHLAYESLRVGGSMPCFMNAANEILVSRFLNKEIGWMEISTKLDTLMQRHELASISAYDELFAIDQQARYLALNI